MEQHLLSQAEIGRAESTLIRDVTLTARPNVTTRIVGKNGVGKTTLLHTILGFLPVISGTRGPELPKPGSRAHQLVFGYMPSSVPRLPSLTIEQWIKALASGYHLDKNVFWERWQELGGRSLPKTQLSDLSSGNLRKALFLGACAIPRQCLILDEPFDEVDKEGQAAMAVEIDAQRDNGASVLIVSHREIHGLVHVDRTVRIESERLVSVQ